MSRLGTTFSGVVRILLSICFVEPDLYMNQAYGSSRIDGGRVRQILHWPGSDETFRKVCALPQRVNQSLHTIRIDSDVSGVRYVRTGHSLGSRSEEHVAYGGDDPLRMVQALPGAQRAA